MAKLRPISGLKDLHGGHGCHPPQVGIKASPNVFVNGKAVHTVGDVFKPHTCGPDTHSDVAAIGSTKVLTNAKPTMRLGDKLAPPSIMVMGAWNVFAGG